MLEWSENYMISKIRKNYIIVMLSKESKIQMDLIECGRLIQSKNAISGAPYIEQSKDIHKMVYKLLRRFAKFEKPDGGSFYVLVQI